MGYIIFNSTASAREHAEVLKNAAASYTAFMNTVDDCNKRLLSCWEGDSADLQSVCSNVNLFYDLKKVVEGLNLLAFSITSFADQIDAVGKGGSGGYVDSASITDENFKGVLERTGGSVSDGYKIAPETLLSFKARAPIITIKERAKKVFDYLF